MKDEGKIEAQFPAIYMTEMRQLQEKCGRKGHDQDSLGRELDELDVF